MKRLIYISLFCLVQATSCMDALWIDEEDKVSINEFTQCVHQRYYYIARLNAVHELIEALQCTCIISYQDFQALSYLQPLHPRIVHCINEMQQSQTCEALLALWDEIKAYKYLSDDECIKEYSSVVCIIAHQLIAVMQEKLSAEDKKTLALVINRAPVQDTISSPDITYRYYLVKRLKKVTTLLKRCAQAPIEYTISAFLPVCTQARIVSCAQAIEKTNSLDPLLAVIKDFEQFQALNDKTFIYELLQLILIVEQHALAPHYLPKRRELCAHYEHDIDGLSVEELLKSIDILTTHIEPYASLDAQRATTLASLGMLTAVACSTLAAWYAFTSKG